MSVYYEIRVAGFLPPGVLLDFEELSASLQEVQTVVHGSLEDQKELRKLLDRLQIFGARLLEIHRLREEAVDADGRDGRAAEAGEKDAAERVADGDAVAALERLHDEQRAPGERGGRALPVAQRRSRRAGDDPVAPRWRLRDGFGVRLPALCECAGSRRRRVRAGARVPPCT